MGQFHATTIVAVRRSNEDIAIGGGRCLERSIGFNENLPGHLGDAGGGQAFHQPGQFVHTGLVEGHHGEVRGGSATGIRAPVSSA